MVCAGCVSSSSKGTIEIRWTIGAGVQTCEEVGLDSVDVILEDDGGRNAYGPIDTPCESGRSGVFIIDDVEAGDYTIVINGYAGDELVYSGQSRDPVAVVEDATVRADRVVLSPIPASLHVLWRFEDGRQCGFHDVEEIAVQAFVNNSVAQDVSALCADGELFLDDVLPGTYDVVATGLDLTTLEPTYRFTAANVTVEAGDQIDVDRVLISCDDIEGNCD